MGHFICGRFAYKEQVAQGKRPHFRCDLRWEQRPMQPDMPIAMAYVPMQRWNQVYDMSRGLTRGTIFPELDLPFVIGRCR